MASQHPVRRRPNPHYHAVTSAAFESASGCKGQGRDFAELLAAARAPKRQRIAQQEAVALTRYSDKRDNPHHDWFHAHRSKRRPN